MKRALSLAVLALAGCGSSASSQADRYSYTAAGSKIAACAHAGRPIALPAAFPRRFPFPAGTDIDATRPLLKGQIGIYGYVPSSGFADTVNFFKAQVPKQGFKLLDFEVDSPNDSEGTYQGHGKLGRWQLRSIPGCSSAMTFAASAEPSR